MSHLTERTEKVCLNCHAAIHGRYCHICGQENIEPKESFWHLVTHFMYDVTHFDGKFFSTLKYLLFRPGFLSHEYLRGRRASYLHPIRMYVFTSALFFLIIFSTRKETEFFSTKESVLTTAEYTTALQKAKQKYVKKLKDSAGTASFARLEQGMAEVDSELAMLFRDTSDATKKRLELFQNKNSNMFGGTKGGSFRTVASYDSAQAALPADERDNYFARKLIVQNIRLKQQYNNDKEAILKAILSKFTHSFPQMLFVSLPLFALMLKLLYVRRKKFYYVNHVIFTIHLYCATFIIILFGMGVTGIFDLFHGTEPSWIKGLIILSAFFFWYKSMRNFYEQGRAKTIFKYIIMFFLSSIMMALIFTVFFLFSAMTI